MKSKQPSASIPLESSRSAPGDQQRSEQELLAALARVRELEQKLSEQQHQLHLVYSSTSWRMTAPVRMFVSTGRKLLSPGQTGVAGGDQETAGSLAVKLRTFRMFLYRYPRLRGIVVALVNRVPRLKEVVHRAAVSSEMASWSERGLDYAEAMSLEKLPPSARSVYQQLHTSFASRQAP